MNAPAPSTAATPVWLVMDSGGRTVGPMTDMQLREGLIVEQWGSDARVATSPQGPWTSAGDVRRQFLNLIQNGWYVRTEDGSQVVGPFAAEKMRLLDRAGELDRVRIRSGRSGNFANKDRYDTWDLPRPMIVPPESAGQPIQSKCRCPHCWADFRPDQVRWIATHNSLRGDTVMGPEAMRRFVASVFTAVDASGDVCNQLACPQCHLQCHLEIPRAVVELQPTFISVVGAPGSGKSYFLASFACMTTLANTSCPDPTVPATSPPITCDAATRWYSCSTRPSTHRSGRSFVKRPTIPS